MSAVRELARELAVLRREVAGLRGPQLAHSSLEDSSVPEFAGDQLVSVWGRQYDGTHGIVTVAGPTPPTPAGVTMTSVPGGVLVTWDGSYEPLPTPSPGIVPTPVVAPMDFQHAEVHVDSDPALSALLFLTKRQEIISARGGEAFVPAAADVPLYARIVVRTTSGKKSLPSPVTGPVAGGKLPTSAIDIDWDTLGGNTIYRQTSAPTGAQKIGDLWLELPNNIAHRWEGETDGWVEARDQGVADALQQAFDANAAAEQAGIDALAAVGAAGDATTVAETAQTAAETAAQAASDAQADADTAAGLAQTAKNTADGKITAFRQPSAPTVTGRTTGDIWIDSDDGKVYVWTGSWTLSDDQRIGQVVTSNATKATIFAQISAPATTGRTVGDLWIDIDDGNTLYDWPTGGSPGWAKRMLGAAAIAASARQLGAITTYRQASAPAATGLLVGDFWIDSDDNKLYRWEGATPAWVAVQDAAIQTAVTNAATAQSTADGKMRIFPQASAPTGLVAGDVGDMWIDTDDGNKSYTWALISGTTYGWVARQLGNSAIQPNSLVASNVIATGTVTAALLEAIIVLATSIIGGSPTGNHAAMNEDGFTVFSVNPVDGTVYLSGQLGGAGADRLALYGTDGLPSISLDSASGRAQFRSIAVQNWPDITDSDWSGVGGNLRTILDRRPRGLVSWGGKYVNPAASSNSAAGIGIYEITARTYPDRMYKLHTSPLRVSGTVVNDLAEISVRATSSPISGPAPAVPTVSSTMIARVHVPIVRTEANPGQIAKLIGPPSAATGPITMRLLLCQARAIGTGNVLVNGNAPEVIEMWLEDIGPWIPNQQVDNSGGGGAVAPAPQAQQLLVNSSWVQSYKADGSVSDNTYAYQGYGDSYNGMQRSFIGFPDVTAQLAGSTITEIAVLLSNEHWYDGSGGVAVLGEHGYAAAPGSLGANRTENMVQSTNWPRGEKRWVTIPLTNSSYWLTGQYRGVMLGTAGMGNSTLYYGRFSSAAQLSIKYTK